MENLKEMIDVNTIVGDPVETPDGGVILTVSKVGFGFATGGSEFSSGSDSGGGSNGESSGLPFGGGSGGGVSITPIAFLVVNSQGVNMLRLEQNTHLFEKMVDMAPTAIDKIQTMLKGNDKNGQKKDNSHQDQMRKNRSDEEQLDYDI